jgi:hypothetical protein
MSDNIESSITNKIKSQPKWNSRQNKDSQSIKESFCKQIAGYQINQIEPY